MQRNFRSDFAACQLTVATLKIVTLIHPVKIRLKGFYVANIFAR